MSDNDRELKSAFDIALERASKLGGISSDEKQKLQEEKLASIGIALSKRYMSGLPVRDVEIELGEYQKAMEKAWQGSQSKLGAVKRKEMKAKGISGSAVEPAIETSTEWLQVEQQLDSTYKKRLEEIKISLHAL